MKKRRIIVNNDFFNIFQIEPPVQDQDILDAVDKIAGTQADALCLDVPGYLLTPDGKSTSYVDPDLLALYSHPEGDSCMQNLFSVLREGKDPFQMVLDRARQRGIEFFASIRLNDTHYKDQPFNPFVEQFYYDNLHNRLGKGEGRVGTEYDYRKTAVREHFLGLIRQTVERYDIDGFELNFTRNCKFFPEPNQEECAPVLTQFMLEVRTALDEWGKRRGKKLCLAALVPYTLHGCRKQGLDIPLWARLGLIDVLCLSSPFLATFDHDIIDTKRKLPGVQVIGGCDRNFAYSFDGSSRVVPMETYRAMAMNYLSQGADGIHLFNVMAWTMNLKKLNAAVKLHGGQGPGDYDRQLLNELGDVETLRHLDKLYVVSHGTECPDRPYGSLPITVPAQGEVTLRLSIGEDVAAASAGRLDKILLQTVSSDCADYNNYTVKLNGIDLARQYAFTPYAPQA